MIKLIRQTINHPLDQLICTDAFAGIGGDSIQLSKVFKSVNSIEKNKSRFDKLKNNLSVYNRKNVTLYNDSYVNLYKTLDNDVVYCDPPWGGINYFTEPNLNIFIDGEPIAFYVNYLLTNVSRLKLVVLKLPKNFDLQELLTDRKNVGYKIYYLNKYLVVFITKETHKGGYIYKYKKYKTKYLSLKKDLQKIDK